MVRTAVGTRKEQIDFSVVGPAIRAREERIIFFGKYNSYMCQEEKSCVGIIQTAIRVRKKTLGFSIVPITICMRSISIHFGMIKTAIRAPPDLFIGSSNRRPCCPGFPGSGSI